MASVSSSLFRRANNLEELLWTVTQQEVSSTTRVCKGGQQGMSCGREQDCPRSFLEDHFSHLNPKQFIQLQLLLEPRYYISHISNTETLLRVGRELICKAFSDGVWSVWRWQSSTKHTKGKKKNKQQLIKQLTEPYFPWAWVEIKMHDRSGTHCRPVNYISCIPAGQSFALSLGESMGIVILKLSRHLSTCW